MASVSGIHPVSRHQQTIRVLILLLPLFAFISILSLAQASGLLEITELLSHPEQYDRQEVVVTGQVTNVQLATNRQGQPAYGFLLKDQAGTLKIVSLGQIEVREGDQVIVEGVFSRLRQAGRTIIYNEIKALSIKPMNRLNPDLVG
jgi:cytochrome c-type biogenesis protein CcmE